MSLILPNQQPKPQPGIQATVGNDGQNVMVQIISTMAIDPDAAEGLAQAILDNASKVKAVKAVISPSINGIRNHIVP